MNEESKKFWKKFYLIFGQNGCSGVGDLERVGLFPISSFGDYPDGVLDPSSCGGDYFVLPRSFRWTHIKFTEKFINEIVGE